LVNIQKSTTIAIRNPKATARGMIDELGLSLYIGIGVEGLLVSFSAFEISAGA
jgi:hypothetical protein